MRKFMSTRGAGAGTERERAAAPSPAAPSPPARRAPPHNGLGTYPNGTAGGGGSEARDERLSADPRRRPALWEDEQFPASWRALGARRPAGVRWRRPHEECVHPRFRGDDDDVVSDAAPSDCTARWRAAGGAGPDVCVAAAALAHTPSLLSRAVPPQSFTRGYGGAFRFRFWVTGAWRDVRVDDRLPVGRACAALRDDYTLPLMEKAYAKLCGSYAAVRAEGGEGGAEGVARALRALTGGVLQRVPLEPRAPAAAETVLGAALPRSTLLLAAGRGDARDALPAGRAYCVTGLARVRGGAALVRMRAAAGAPEWRGEWAPGGERWRALASPDRELLAERAADDEFWMSVTEFARAFCELVLVHVAPDDWLLEPALQTRRPWRAVLARRRWRAGYNAGGPPHAATADANPQFRLEVPGASEGASDDGACHVVVSVMQQHAAGQRARLVGVGLAVYALGAGEARRAVCAADTVRAREVAALLALPPGRYAVVPHAARAGVEAAFLLRVLTDRAAHVWEVNEDNAVVRGPADHLPPRLAAPECGTVRTSGRARTADEELDAAGVRAALRGAGAAASLELCRALVALRDEGYTGHVRARHVPALHALLADWQRTFAAGAARAGGCGRRARLSSYRLRERLRAAGVLVSNKVLEGVVIRYARRAALSADRFAQALARLHLAHERFRAIDTKVKCNPLSLEEVILMTLYS